MAVDGVESVDSVSTRAWQNRLDDAARSRWARCTYSCVVPPTTSRLKRPAGRENGWAACDIAPRIRPTVVDVDPPRAAAKGTEMQLSVSRCKQPSIVTCVSPHVQPNGKGGLSAGQITPDGRRRVCTMSIGSCMSRVGLHQHLHDASRAQPLLFLFLQPARGSTCSSENVVVVSRALR
jgi:hypothetical protein